MTLTDFYEGENKDFNVNITLNGTIPNITGDTVTFTMKQTAGGAVVLEKEADVTTSGASGIAIFELDTDDTAITPRTYIYNIVWIRSTGYTKTLEQGNITVMDSVTLPISSP